MIYQHWEEQLPDASSTKDVYDLTATCAFDTLTGKSFSCAVRGMKCSNNMLKCSIHGYLEHALTHTCAHTHNHWLAAIQRISPCFMHLRHRGGREWMSEERQTSDVCLCSVSSLLISGQSCSEALDAESMWRGDLLKLIKWGGIISSG